jgi:adenine-specific DNA-methyltransferase
MTGNTNTATDFRNTILNGDSVQLMRALPRNAVDFILTDPPYLVNYQGRDGRKVRNDDNARWLRPAFNQMHRVLKSGGFAVSFYGWNRIDLFADAWKAAGFRMVGHIVFRKSYSSSSRFLRYEHESAYLLAKGNVTPPAKPIPDVIDMPYSGNKMHPTQKPVAALLPLVEVFCPVVWFWTCSPVRVRPLWRRSILGATGWAWNWTRTTPRRRTADWPGMGRGGWRRKPPPFPITGHGRKIAPVPTDRRQRRAASTARAEGANRWRLGHSRRAPRAVLIVKPV